MKLTGKIALVTGASRGIGRAIAEDLARCGASVIINYVKDIISANDVVKKIRDEGGYAIAIKRDVSKYSEAQLLVEEVIDKFGRIDILVNNAGISKLGLFVDMIEEDWNEVLDTNLRGTINVSHSAVKFMLDKKNGCIVNISSIWGSAGAACEVAYSVSKGGINSFTRALAKELAPSNIRVNAIAPGVIDTEMNNWLSEIDKDKLIEEIPMGVFGQCEDIASLAAFLCSNGAKYITGQVITIDGGLL
jgi:3-oxoacyl-[acyl-carrier protein] reductase